MVPEQRSCCSTSDAVNVAGLSCVFGLMQRTKCAFVVLRSAISWLRSLMYRRATELNEPPFLPPPPLAASASAAASSAKSVESSALAEPRTSPTRSAWSVSLFLSAKPATA